MGWFSFTLLQGFRVPGLVGSGVMQDNSGVVKMSDKQLLRNAFVLGFLQSREGYNAEYPFDFHEDEIREALDSEFEQWYHVLDLVDNNE